jgi:DNA-binding transcriptional LysR family regulator
MPHDITALRYTVLAADTHSFARAAELVGVKQATLSRRISQLESRMGLTLFARTTRGAMPTEAGQGFVEHARSILADLDELIVKGRAIGAGRVGTLALGFSTSLASGSMRTLIVDFLNRYPDVRMIGIEKDRSYLCEALRARTADFAVISGEISLENLKRHPLWSERVMLVLSATHPLSEKGRIYWTDLRGERFILPQQDPGADLADMLTARLCEPGNKPDVVTHDVTRDNIINMVSLGRFLSITTETTLGRTFPGVLLREIHDSAGPTHINYAGYWRHDNSNPPVAQMLRLVGERYPC